MTYVDAVGRARRVAGWSAVALGAAIPISTAADAVLLVLILIAASIGARSAVRESWTAVMANPPVTAAALLFALLLIACMYSVAGPDEGFSVLGKYLDLILIPVLMWGALDPKVRALALAAFGVAVVLNLYVSYSAAAGLPGLRHPAYPIGFKASVTHSLIISLGAFLFLLYARETRSMRWRIALIALAAVCAHNVLFIVIGRTGYVVLGLLLAFYLTTLFRGWRGPVVAAAVVCALAVGAYVSSRNLQTRVNEIGSDISQWHPGARDETSVGQRLEYYRTTLEIISEHPLIGVGTGGFAAAYAAQVRATGARATVNPHNDYLLIAAQVGLPGLALLIALYIVTWRSASRLSSSVHRDLARGLVIAFAAGGLFNSLLLDHTEGLLFAWLTAVLYAGYNPAHNAAGARA